VYSKAAALAKMATNDSRITYLCLLSGIGCSSVAHRVIKLLQEVRSEVDLLDYASVQPMGSFDKIEHGLRFSLCQ